MGPRCYFSRASRVGLTTAPQGTYAGSRPMPGAVLGVLGRHTPQIFAQSKRQVILLSPVYWEGGDWGPRFQGHGHCCRALGPLFFLTLVSHSPVSLLVLLRQSMRLPGTRQSSGVIQAPCAHPPQDARPPRVGIPQASSKAWLGLDSSKS